MLSIVGATLVVALVGSRWLHTRCRMGAHKGRPYTYRFGPDAQHPPVISPLQLKRRNRSAFITTDTDEKAIARLASIGLSSGPPNR